MDSVCYYGVSDLYFRTAVIYCGVYQMHLLNIKKRVLSFVESFDFPIIDKYEMDYYIYNTKEVRYMDFNNYKKYISKETLMGPNSVRILEELLGKYPFHFTAEDRILDLGCGKGLTSLVLAKETNAKIYADDLWIKAEENAKRFADWKIHQQVIPVCEDASELSFEKDYFQAMVSVDAYHYFAGEDGFFENKILPFLKEKAVVLIGIPGIKDEYADCSDEYLSPWLGSEAYMFKSPQQWKNLIGDHARIEHVNTWEMECFDQAWNDWFETNHKYACSDREHFQSVIKPYTCFVGVYIKLL